MFDKFQSRLNLTGEVKTLTAIRIGAGRSTSPISSDLPVVRDAEGSPYIPGSSFKGVLRSYVESILRSIASHRRIVCNPTDNAEQCITREEMKLLREKRNDQLILEKTCWVCQIFGSLWYASKLQIRDLHVQPNIWFDQYQQRDGVAIDRDTETASDGKLYDYEVVPAGVVFDFHAIVDNAEDWQLGMLYLGLSAFEKGELTIGGGSSRGLGGIKLLLNSASYIDKHHIIPYLTDDDYEDKDADWEPWVKAFRTKINQQLEAN
ncbi:CRISPR-associated RAMP protein [Candidatus Poribacteria bacterium]|nr:CRISPR-associated RAMP protein [Candidatus Poribacteria bacterium]MYB01042.1 CRISPR-associated RAMP protein [Candidatus Poribacteria bacterium]